MGFPVDRRRAVQCKEGKGMAEMKDGLLGIQEVASLFDMSVVSVRKYKDQKLLKVSDKRGNKDLFDREDVLLRKQIIQKARVEKGLNLSQIAERMDDFVSAAKKNGASPKSVEPAREGNGKLKVLVAEDDEQTVSAIEDVFSDTYQIMSAMDGVEALTKAISEKPGLILLDLRLPTLDGFQVCRSLRENPITMDIPIIMITALADLSDKISGIEAGADDYITKPFALEELEARMRMVLRRVYEHPVQKVG